MCGSSRGRNRVSSWWGTVPLGTVPQGCLFRERRRKRGPPLFRRSYAEGRSCCGCGYSPSRDAAWEPRPGSVLHSRRLAALPHLVSPLRNSPRPEGAGLLSDADSRPPSGCTGYYKVNRCRPGAASHPTRAAHQRPSGPPRAPVAGPVLLLSPRRCPHGRGDPVRGARSGTWSATRYVERNPVRAGLVAVAEAYPWSSAAPHCGLRADAVLSEEMPLTGAISNWSLWLSEKEDAQTLELLRRRTMKGLPCGSDDFVAEIEAAVGRTLSESG